MDLFWKEQQGPRGEVDEDWERIRLAKIPPPRTGFRRIRRAEDSAAHDEQQCEGIELDDSGVISNTAEADEDTGAETSDGTVMFGLPAETTARRAVQPPTTETGGEAAPNDPLEHTVQMSDAYPVYTAPTTMRDELRASPAEGSGVGSPDAVDSHSAFRAAVTKIIGRFAGIGSIS